MVDTVVEPDGIRHDSLEVKRFLPPSGNEFPLEVDFKAPKVDYFKGFIIP